MAGRCTVCRHPRLAEIDAALVEGESPYDVVAHFGSLSRPAVQGHKERHLPAKLVRAQQVKEFTEGDALMQRVLGNERRARDLYDAAWGMYQEARAASNPNVALRAIGEARKVLGEMRQTAALLFGRRDVRDLEEKLDTLLEQIENDKRRKGHGYGFH